MRVARKTQECLGTLGKLPETPGNIWKLAATAWNPSERLLSAACFVKPLYLRRKSMAAGLGVSEQMQNI